MNACTGSFQGVKSATVSASSMGSKGARCLGGVVEISSSRALPAFLLPQTGSVMNLSFSVISTSPETSL